MWTNGHSISATYTYGYDDLGLYYVIPQQTFIDEKDEFLSLPWSQRNEHYVQH